MDAFGYQLPVLITAIGAGLLILETLIPGGVFMIVGVTLFLAGIAGILIPSLGTPFGLCAAILVLGPVIYLLYSRFDFYGGDGSGVRGTSDASSLKGATGHVTETVTQTNGRVKLDNGGMDPHYMARSTTGTIEPGTDIVVVDPGGGNKLRVEPASEADAE